MGQRPDIGRLRVRTQDASIYIPFVNELVVPNGTLAITGEAEATLTPGFYINVKNYGAVGDRVLSSLASTTASSNVVNCSDLALTLADIGKLFDISNAGAQTTLSGKVLTVNSATSITLDNPASFTTSGQTLTIDGITFTDGVSTAGSATITSATAAFTSADEGKIVRLTNAGAKNLVGTITGVNSATQFTMSITANLTVTGRKLIYGTNNTATIQDAITAANSIGASVYSSTGGYCIGAVLSLSSAGMTFFGDGMNRSMIYTIGPVMGSSGTYFNALNVTRPSSGIRFEKIGFSGTNWYAQPLSLGPSADGVYVDPTSGSGVIDGVTVDACKFDSFWGIGFHVPGSLTSPSSWIIDICISSSRGSLNALTAFNPNPLKFLRFVNNYMTHNGSGGVEAAASQATIIGNHAYYNGSGFSIGGWQDPDTGSTNTVMGNTAEFNGNTGISIASNQIDTLVSGNIARRNGNIGFQTSNSGTTLGKRATMVGNVASSNGRTGSASPVGIFSNTPNCYISHNYVVDESLTGYSQLIGIEVFNVDNTVWNNDCVGHGSYDYNLDNFTGNIYFFNLHAGITINIGSNVTVVYPTSRFADVGVAAAHGASGSFKTLTELTTIAAAATTDTTIQIPDNVIIMSVSVRVTTAIPTAATFTVTGAITATVFNTQAVSTVVNTSDPGTKAGAVMLGYAQAVRITPNLTPASAAGRVRVVIVYYQSVAPTS